MMNPKQSADVIAAATDMAKLADDIITALYDVDVQPSTLAKGQTFKPQSAYSLLNERGKLAETAIARIAAARAAIASASSV